MMFKTYAVIKRHALRLLFSLTILLFFILHATLISEQDFINALENKAYDVRVELTMPNTVDPRIVIVEIDERSLNQIGRWPWNRSVIANLIKQLFNTYHIDVLGMNAVFAETDNSSGLKQLQTLAQGALKNAFSFLEILETLKETLDYDRLLANSIQNRRIVLSYAFTDNQKMTQYVEVGQLPPPVFSREEIPALDKCTGCISANGFAGNLPALQANAMTAGYFNLEPDTDGIVRRVPILYGYKGQLYESLSLAVARVALGNPKIKLGIVTKNNGSQGINFLQVGSQNIPVTGDIHSLITFRGQRNSFQYLSASDVLKGEVKNSELLRNKIVLLGVTAEGLGDLRATPIEKRLPDVEIHANLISAILDNRIMGKTDDSSSEVLLLVLIGLVMIIVLPLLSPLLATLGTIAVFGFVFLLNVHIWEHYQLVFPIATTFLLIIALFIFNMSYGYFLESTNKRHLTGLFGQYVPLDLVDEMSQNPSRQFSMAGESREMSVLFSDVRGFTHLSEGLTPTELSQLMNEYLTPMTRAIHEHRGTIDKYIGDAIMAFWGAPLYDSQHARHAIDAAVEMQDRLKEMQSQFKEKGWPEIKIGIGINTGIMNVGNMGSQFRKAYTVLGDAVNLGSRLEGATKEYDVPIIVSESTMAAAPEYLYRPLDRVRVRGKDQSVAIFEPIGLHGQVALDVMAEIAHYEQALEHYRQQRWGVAKEKFSRLSEEYPNRFLYSLYMERIAHFMKYPPADNWDCVYTFTSK